MKVYQNQINNILKDIISQKYKALLLYGPNKGYINNIIKLIIEKCNLTLTSLESNKINASSLCVLLNNQNFFSKRECIKIYTNNINSEVQDLLLTNYLNFPVFIFDELPASSSARQFFEKHNELIIIACYYFDKNAVTALIKERFIKEKKRINQECLDYLSSILSESDYQFLNNELDKLLLYAAHKEQIIIEDAIAVISDNNYTINCDDLCVYLITKNLQGFIKELDRLYDNNTSLILILRSFIRYYYNLYRTIIRINNGSNIELAIKKLSPPIFFKQLENFKKIITKISLQEVLKALYILQQAEKKYKQYDGNFDIYNNVYNLINQ